jgi:antitoxin PrlF
MNLAKVSSNGQITVPVEIRRKLNIKEGDKIIFWEKPDGEIVLQNSSVFAVRQAQNNLSDINRSEDEILQDVMDIRSRMVRQNRNEDNETLVARP